jgi:hypothetical protein
LSLSTLHPLISSPFGFFRCTDPRRGCPSLHGKKGLKAQRLVKMEKDKMGLERNKMILLKNQRPAK